MMNENDILERMKSDFRVFDKTGSIEFMAKAQALGWVLELNSAQIEKIYLEAQKEG